MSGDIEERVPTLTVLQQIHAFVRERGECCEPTKDAHNNKQALEAAEPPMNIGNVRKKTDNGAADDIDSQRADGECRRPADLLRKSAEKIPANRTDEAPGTDNEQTRHILPRRISH
jgi:hypothetical protein